MVSGHCWSKLVYKSGSRIGSRGNQCLDSESYKVIWNSHDVAVE